MASLGAVTGMGSEMITSVFKFLVIMLPVFAGAIGLGLLFFFLRKRKVFDIDVTLYTVSDNNLIKSRDRGGIVKNLLGNEEFRFLKRKKSCPVPPRKHWMLQDNGKFSIEFYRHSEDDFEPIEGKVETEEQVEENEEEVVQKPGFLTRIGSHFDKNYPLDARIKSLDKKGPLMHVKFTPIKSDSKQFLNMKAKEIVYKNKIQKPFEKYAPMIMWGGLCITLIFMVIWYFKYAGILTEKQLSCIDPSMAKTMIQEICHGTVTEGIKSPF